MGADGADGAVGVDGAAGACGVDGAAAPGALGADGALGAAVVAFAAGALGAGVLSASASPAAASEGEPVLTVEMRFGVPKNAFARGAGSSPSGAMELRNMTATSFTAAGFSAFSA